MSETDYLVNYGRGAFLGRFQSTLSWQRDDRVVVRTPRGLELATVLGPAGALAEPEVSGPILRRATTEDLDLSARLNVLAVAIIADAQRTADDMGLPFLFLDGEILLDRQSAILQAVHWSDCDASALFEKLSDRHGLLVQLADLTSKSEAKAAGCERCGAEKSGCSSCGTGGGGCSSGSCSKGSVKSADDLTEYFAGLRRQMEAAAPRISIH